jgi:hypothetical protein
MSGETEAMLMQHELDEIEADAKVATSLYKEACAQFERTAAELAGQDETLHRVLLARLIDAYHAGEAVHSRVFAARLERHYAWLGAHAE